MCVVREVVKGTVTLFSLFYFFVRSLTSSRETESRG